MLEKNTPLEYKCATYSAHNHTITKRVWPRFVICSVSLHNQTVDKVPAILDSRKALCVQIYIAHTTLPDTAYRATRLAQVTKVTLNTNDTKDLKAMIKYLRTSKGFYLFSLSFTLRLSVCRRILIQDS